MYRELSIPGYSIARRYGIVSSTMDVARDLVLQGELMEDQFALIMADEQHAGRGRQGRSWLTAQESFMGTFVYPTRLSIGALAGYSLSVGLGVSDALLGLGCACELKWPNDLVVVEHGTFRKLGGILIEVEDLGTSPVILVGVGLNISRPPVELSQIAVSLDQLTAAAVPVEELAHVLAGALAANHSWFEKEGGFATRASAWEERSCFRPGKTEVSIELGSEQVSGLYLGITESGALRVSCRDGERVIHSGHITRVEL